MKLRLQSGEEAVALAFDRNLFKLSSSRAFAPGSPIRFTAVGEEGERGFEGRVLGSKRVGDRKFELRMRFVNLRREDREWLAREVGG